MALVPAARLGLVQRPAVALDADEQGDGGERGDGPGGFPRGVSNTTSGSAKGILIIEGISASKPLRNGTAPFIVNLSGNA